MINRKQVRQTARAFQQGVGSMVAFVEGEGPKLLRRAGESLHLVKPRRRLAPVGIALGLLGAVAVLGLAASAGAKV